MNNLRKVGKKRQLLMLVPVILPDQSKRRLRILVDTGAEANVIRMGMLPNGLFEETVQPLNFVTANGESMRGGRRTIEIRLCFQLFVVGRPVTDFFWSTTEFYEGDIKVDAILSYPWLEENRVGIFPHHNALAVDKPEFALLYGLDRKYAKEAANKERLEQRKSKSARKREKQRQRRMTLRVCEAKEDNGK